MLHPAVSTLDFQCTMGFSLVHNVACGNPSVASLFCASDWTVKIRIQPHPLGVTRRERIRYYTLTISAKHIKEK